MHRLSRGWGVVSGPREYFLAIRQDHASRIDGIRSVFCSPPVDGYGIAGLERVFPPTVPVQTVRRPAFTCVIDNLAGGFIFRIDVEIDVRIHPLHFRDFAGELDRFVSVILRCERVVSDSRARSRHQTENDACDSYQMTFHGIVLLESSSNY